MTTSSDVERFDAVERKFGIDTYTSPHVGFAAVSKARYSDFLVREVDDDGKVAKLEKIVLPEPKPENTNETDKDDKKVKQDEKKNLKESSPSSASEKLTLAEKELASLIGKTPASEAIALLKHWSATPPPSPEDSDAEKSYLFPVMNDKQTRKKVHEFIKSPHLAPYAVAETTDERRIRLFPMTFRKMMKNYGAYPSSNNGAKRKRQDDRRSRAPWPRDRPDYLKFVLYKENMDTPSALRELMKKGRIDFKKGVGYAGMKDKRGVTCQFCTVYHEEEEDLLAVNEKNMSVCARSDDSGGGASFFLIGGFSYAKHNLRLGKLKGNRFEIVLRNVTVDSKDNDSGAKTCPKDVITTAAQSLEKLGFINYFGMQRFGKFHDTHEVGSAIIRSNFESAVDIIMREKSDENERNAALRRQWATRFSADAARPDLAERKAAEDLRRRLGRFMVCENAIVDSLVKAPLDYHRAFRNIPKNSQLMFLHAWQSYLWNRAASFRIEKGGAEKVMAGDLILETEGDTGLKGKTVKVVEKGKEEEYDIADVVLPLVGGKIVFPENETGEFIRGMLKEFNLTQDDLTQEKNKEYSLGGDYRRLICRPSDVEFEVKQYRDPHETLIFTDFMKIQKDKNDTEKTSKVKKDDAAPLLTALVISFTLPPSSYATIALRELMKRPTSSEYQKMLEVDGGSCERNIQNGTQDESDSAVVKDEPMDVENKDEVEIKSESEHESEDETEEKPPKKRKKKKSKKGKK
eukprot:CAMPEP_0172485496 /NCGR_PEP_ID=MMETSP1066-20121228/13534_1 /TAXON_ID=671091 /ORGANISM="Coscinodiscus wailesii, Strain CCMP2513" /LENGTH=744 /DNA_ID=CAMNT_0013250795 /DNA_START=58 /DNA_END=2292 /DNA_ORIENTATION=-